MDIFKFKNPTDPTLMEQGELINGLKSKLWIERYATAGEFEFISSEDAMSKLPIGSFVSHIESTEVMVVENHEINRQRGKETEIKITGRSFESFLENRIVGSNQDWPTEATAEEEYVIFPAYSWDQAVELLQDHIYLENVFDPDDALLHVQVLTNIEEVGDELFRSVKRGSLYARLLEILSYDNLGIKTIRPGIRSPLGQENTDLVILVHKGEDLSENLVFSYETGEIESADYLWSNKKLKNAALITGRWIETVVKIESSGIDRRMMYVDGTDLDSAYSEAPTGPDRDAVIFEMQSRGLSELLAQREVALVKTEATKTASQYRYREHYDLGDIITVDGEYHENALMQISEYVEIEDEKGEVGYPTFAAI